MQIDKHKELVKKEGISALPYIRCYGAEVRVGAKHAEEQPCVVVDMHASLSAYFATAGEAGV